MITDPNLEPTGFLQTVSVALKQLKQQLQDDYEKSYPQLRDIIHLVVDEEESHAWDLSFFPHLLLPDLVEAHLARLNLRSVKAQHRDAFAAQDFNSVHPYASAVSFCS
jgi:hypothetical protein